LSYLQDSPYGEKNSAMSDGRGQNGGKRVGAGRPKGSLSAAGIVKRELGYRVLPDKVERRMWKLYLQHEDKSIRWEAFKLAKAYKSGKPKESVEVAGSLVDTLRESLEAGMKRIEKEQAKQTQVKESKSLEYFASLDDSVASGSPN